MLWHGWPPLYAAFHLAKGGEGRDVVHRMSSTRAHPPHERVTDTGSLETAPCSYPLHAHTDIYIYIYIYGELWIYRTLMHNALRDDGKYGYITRQRPMLFSPASHWLMLIRKSNVAGNRRARGTKMEQRAFIKASLMDPSLPLFLSLSLAVLFLPRKRAKPSKSWEIALQFPRKLFGYYYSWQRKYEGLLLYIYISFRFV